MASDSVFFFVFSNGSPLEVFENSSRRPFIFLKAKKQRVIRVGNRSSYLSPFSFPRVQNQPGLKLVSTCRGNSSPVTK